MTGRVDESLKRFVAHRIDELVESLIQSALDRWRQNAWHRFNDLEGNCAIQLYRHAGDAIADDAVLGHLRIQLEWYQPTLRMLDGTDSAASMKRPDLRVTLTRTVGRTIECKRLKLTEGLPKAYVTNGILRFVTGSYSADEPMGFMIGFVVADTPVAVAASINDQVKLATQLDQTDQLQVTRPSRAGHHRYGSSHKRPQRTDIELAHHLVDLTI